MTEQMAPVGSYRYPPLDVALERVRTRPSVTVADAVALIGQSEGVVRRAIESGDIAHIRLGRNIRVLSAPLRRQLGLE